EPPETVELSGGMTSPWTLGSPLARSHAHAVLVPDRSVGQTTLRRPPSGRPRRYPRRLHRPEPATFDGSSPRAGSFGDAIGGRTLRGHRGPPPPDATD